MNFIINGFHEETFFPLISRTLKYFNVKHIHLTYNRLKLDAPSNADAFFYAVKDLAIGKYDVMWDDVTPLDEDIVEKMNDCEVVALKMMDRHSLSIEPPLSYDERKRIYLKHLRYWNHVIEKNNIDLFLSSSPPHEVYDFVIYCLCKIKKIPTVLFFQTSIADTITIMEDWKVNNIDIKHEYQKLLEKYQFVDESSIFLSGRFERDFKFNTEKKNPVRFEMLRKKPKTSVMNNIMPLLAKLTFRRFLLLVKNSSLLIQGIVSHVNYVDRIIKGKKALKFYRDNVLEPDLSQKYIYFPLHLQPEATTSPMASVYVEQVLIAQMLSYYLPDDVYIYVKENPFQVAARRNIKFYKELLEISQVRFISDSFSTYDLIDNSLSVATATGTAGLEALYRCKPVLMFGYNFYQYARGVFQIKSGIDCQKALNEVITNRFRPSIKDIKIFLKALEHTTIEGYIDVDYRKDTRVNDEISNENIFRVLVNKIKSVCHL